MTWLDMAISLAKEFEGCSLEAYPDPVYGWRKATVGYGATGPAIVQGTVWTQAQADADLAYRMGGIGTQIDALVTVPISDEQKGALCDFAYNEGIGNLQRSTLLSLLNAGQIQAAADQFPVWDLAGGEVLPGLVARRAAERGLFILGSNFSQDKSPGEPQPQPEQST
jgi:lysozyme